MNRDGHVGINILLKNRALLNRNLIFYVLMIAIFGFLLRFVFYQGTKLEIEQYSHTSVGEAIEETNALDHPIEGSSQAGALAILLTNLSQNAGHPLSLLLLQIATIIVFSRLLGFIFTKIGQPMVIGEIIAGIVLGPSVLGLFWPQISSYLFQPDSLSNLQFFSQFGLILFMFLIGLELDIDQLQHKAHTAVVVSHVSIIFPFFLGVCLAYYLFGTLAPPHISFLAFGLFMGIAMSITAFPVLARIIHERGLTQSSLGTLAITCAAADDVTAWCLLAAVIAIVKAGTATSAVFTVLLSIVYVLFMLKVVRPLFQHLGARNATTRDLNRTFLASSFALLVSSAFMTEVIGIHALFGAFMAGVCMPPQAAFRKLLAARIEDVSLIILLPLFFAFTGLKTQIGLLNDGYAWLICGLIILVAVAGKFGGSFVAARVTGQSWSDSLTIGALMNTRGLMELIVLIIGYDLGVFSPTLFTMMVLMALITTFMTCPALSVINFFHRKREPMGVKSLPERL